MLCKTPLPYRINVPFAAAFLAVISIPCFAQSVTNFKNLPWGEPTQGLRMSLSIHNPDGAVPKIHIAFENVGESDAVLSLGQMSNIRPKMKPQAVSLVVVDARNNSMEIHYFDRKSVIGGNGRGQYLVPLRVGSTYSLKLDLGTSGLSPTQDAQNLTQDDTASQPSLKGKGTENSSPKLKRVLDW